jgi:mono/diheme cytochrome c family protein
MIARALAAGVILIATAIAGIAMAAESPQNLYTLNCWGCHRANGKGIAGTAPPLTNAADYLKVPGGREYLIRVPGVSQSLLNDADTALVMNWIIGNFSPGRVPAGFKPFTAEEIHQARAQAHLYDITETRMRLLNEMVAMKIRPAAK